MARKRRAPPAIGEEDEREGVPKDADLSVRALEERVRKHPAQEANLLEQMLEAVRRHCCLGEEALGRTAAGLQLKEAVEAFHATRRAFGYVHGLLHNTRDGDNDADETSALDEPNGSSSLEMNDTLAALADWVDVQKKSFSALAIDALCSADTSHGALKKTALGVLVAQPAWDSALRELVQRMLTGKCRDAPTLIDDVCQLLGSKYDDVRLVLLQSAHSVCLRAAESAAVLVVEANVLKLLGCVGGLVQQVLDMGKDEYVEQLLEETRKQGEASHTGAKRKKVDERGSGRSLLKAQRRAYGEAWLAFLGLDLSAPVQAQVLKDLSHQVLPVMSHPVRLSDFLTNAYNLGGVSSFLALEALFFLVQNHSLDYPLFYHKLYSLLTTDLFVMKDRAKYMDLISMFVISRYIPGYLVAAFLKRLLRRAMLAPAYGSLWCVRLAVQLVRKHPSVYFLVHRTFNDTDGAERRHTLVGLDFFSAGNDADTGNGGKDATVDPAELAAVAAGVDVYDDTEIDPARCGAMQSSLWEIEALRRHYCPAVARFCEAFSADVRRKGAIPPPPQPPGGVSEFSSVTFETLFNAEVSRRAKEVPLAYRVPEAPPEDQELSWFC
ncbi:Nucleolar complex protein 4-like [Porphyridium purpureum]|uniref:Nucleolar complex protein 4-like n=1 Tax=Porphyridium purpureum TaxID=35688 RepID=A0A5J4YMT2_PORPP|nr:Nucleolar complex protein 4-like [Porphyridium purpureum]|eukprot:POR4117..scf295_9